MLTCALEHAKTVHIASFHLPVSRCVGLNIFLDKQRAKTQNHACTKKFRVQV